MSNNILKRISKLFMKSKVKGEINHTLAGYKNTDIDMNNLIDSINKSKTLYNLMKVKFHPDKYHNSIFYSEIVTYYQLITENKTDFGKLSEINEQLNKLINN